MWSLLLALAVPDDIIGWDCSIERELGGRHYQLIQSIEGTGPEARKRGGYLRIRWDSASTTFPNLVDLFYADGALSSDTPDLFNIFIPTRKKRPKAQLWIAMAGGEARLIESGPQLLVMNFHGNLQYLQSQNRDLNRALWSAGSFTMIVKDEKGRVIGSRNVAFDRDEVARVVRESVPALDAKLADPTNPKNNCRGYDFSRYIVV